MSTKNFTITIVRTGDYVEVCFMPHDKTADNQRMVIQRNDIRETLLNISDQLRTTNHAIHGVSDLPKAQEPSGHAGWDFQTNQPIASVADKQTVWSTKVGGKYNTNEWLARKISDSVATADKADRDFFNRWTSGTASSPLTTKQTVKDEKPGKESLGGCSLESLKETIEQVDKKASDANMPHVDVENLKKFSQRHTSPGISFEGNIVRIDRKTACLLNTALNKISEAFNGNFVSVGYSAGDTISLSPRRNVSDYYYNLVSTLLKAVSADKLNLVLPVVSDFIQADKVDLLIAVLETSYLCVGGKGYMFPQLLGMNLDILKTIQIVDSFKELNKEHRNKAVMGRNMEIAVITKLRCSGVLFRQDAFDRFKLEAGSVPYEILPTQIAETIGCSADLMVSRAIIYLILTRRVKISAGAYMPFWYRVAGYDPTSTK